MKIDKAGKNFKLIRVTLNNANFLETLCKKSMTYDDALTILIKAAKQYTDLITA